MSYQSAYTISFRSLDNTLWGVDIYINGYNGRPLEICLEGDEPCIIEWQETGKTDVVQSATCTLRVSNESDRQMAQLIDRPDAACLVWREGKPYWWGHLDDAVYEEPYSFTKAYVTELTFSDFGILNRIPFTLAGKQSVGAIVRDCLDSIGYGNGATINLYTSLLEPKTQQPITLDMLYINADRFAPDGDSWDAMTSKREVLEEILRPLGLRIMQKNAQIYIYDPEWLRDHASHHRPTVWKGTDAYLRGSEKYGRFEVEFDTDAYETLAELGIDADNEAFTESDSLFGMKYSEDLFLHDTDCLQIGFFVETYRNPNVPSIVPPYGLYIPGIIHVPAVAFPDSAVSISNKARWFRTRPVFADTSDVGIAWRIICNRIIGYSQFNGMQAQILGHVAATPSNNHPTCRLADTLDVFTLETGYLPVAPDAGKFELRVNLDVLLSFRDDPIDDPPDEWVERQPWYYGKEHEWRCARIPALMVPVKLEVINEYGEAILHYVNASIEDVLRSAAPYPPTIVAKATPRAIGQGGWDQGPAGGFGDMVLSYYRDWDPDDTDRDPLVTRGWTGNRQTCISLPTVKGTLYSVRDDGEYVPLPPAAGRLRLTVGSGVFPVPVAALLSYKYEYFAWHLFRNPSITLVRARRRDDGIKTDTVSERHAGPPDSDLLSETVKAGTWRKGIAPSARGLFFDANGTVWEKFAKGFLQRTLEELRINYLKEQTSAVQPVLEGTAELDPFFGAKTERLTPGVFLVTAIRQDLHQGTEHLTMARMANAGGLDYSFAWGDPLCILVEGPYTFAWTGPVCAQDPGPFRFAWSNPVCALRYDYNLEWDEMPPEKPED